MLKLHVKAHEKHKSKHDTLSYSICDIRTNITVSKHNIRSTRKPTRSSVLDLGSWLGMVNDASGLLFMTVQEVVVPGYGWRKGRSKPFSSRRRRKAAVPHLQDFGL